MKVELNKAYRDLALATAEVSGRGESIVRFEKIWTILCICLFLVALSPILLVAFRTNWVVAKQVEEVVVHRVAPPIGGVLDDELDLTPRVSTDTIHYNLSEKSKAINTAWLHNVPIKYRHDQDGVIVGYDVKYPVNVRQESM